MLSRKSAGSVLFLTFLMLSGVAAADESGGFTRSEEPLAGTNFDLTLSPSSPIGCGYRTGISGAWSQPGSWTLPILAQGMEGYVLTAVMNGTGSSGFTGVALQSTIATEAGYFGDPIPLAGNTVPTSLVSESSTAAFLITGVFFTGGVLRRQRALAR